MSERRIVAGYVRRAHGIRGEVIVRSLSDDPDRFTAGASFLTDETPPRALTVVRSRSHPDGALLQFEGLDDRTAAEGLRGVSLTIAADERRQLVADEYWPDQLVGLEAVGPDGATLGEVTDVVLGAAQDRLVVTTPEGAPVEVPFVAAIVGEIRDGLVEIDPPDGLFPD